jgi:hypothetical protein
MVLAFVDDHHHRWLSLNLSAGADRAAPNRGTVGNGDDLARRPYRITVQQPNEAVGETASSASRAVVRLPASRDGIPRLSRC